MKEYQSLFLEVDASAAVVTSLESLKSNETSTLEWGLIALQCLIHQHSGNQRAVNRAGGFDVIVNELKLHTSSPNIARLCCMCLAELSPEAIENAETPGQETSAVLGYALSETCCNYLIAALEMHKQDPRVVEAGCKAIACMSLSETNQSILCRNRACETITAALNIQYDFQAHVGGGVGEFSNHEAVRQVGTV